MSPDASKGRADFFSFRAKNSLKDWNDERGSRRSEEFSPLFSMKEGISFLDHLVSMSLP